MYRRSVLRSDHLVPHMFYVLENNVLLCVECVTVLGRHCADAMLTKWFSEGKAANSVGSPLRWSACEIAKLWLTTSGGC
jgi:hypothetical protein